MAKRQRPDQRLGPLLEATPEKENKAPLTGVSEDTARDTQILNAVGVRLKREQYYGRVPLFVIGAGISSLMVPLLREIGSWLNGALQNKGVPEGFEWIMSHAASVEANDATRREAAEFFSALQTEQAFRPIWRDFSAGFLATGLELQSDRWPNGRFEGLCSAKSTPAHRVIADLLWVSKAYAVSLNFDGLTHMALQECDSTGDGSGGLSLHTVQQLEDYFTADTKEFIPAVIKIRGDVFFAKCERPSCPLFNAEYPLDRILSQNDASAILKCPVCSRSSLQLQFSFPGYRAKEEAAHPMLWATRRFLADRIAAIIIIGLSGRWDRYLLRFLFDMAVERRLPVIDVKPRPWKPNQDEFIDHFRTLYYPSIPAFDPNDPRHPSIAPLYYRSFMDADVFTASLKPFLYSLGSTVKDTVS